VKKETKLMLRNIIMIDIIIGLVSSIVILIFWSSYTQFLILGLAIAIINFSISSIITDLLLNNIGPKNLSLYIISFLLRISIVSIIGYIVFTYNKFNVLAYMVGYTMHLIGVYVHSIKQKL
jgi:ATP synthase protein I